MTRLIPLFALTLGACGDTFDAGTLSFDTEALVASFVQTASVGFDSDGDDEMDGTQNRIGIVLTDREDLCDLGTPVDEVDDILAVQIIALHVDGGDALRTNVSLFEALLSPSAGNQFVGMLVTERVGGETVAQYATRNLVDATGVGTAEMLIGSRTISNGRTTRLSASFEGTLGADLTDPSQFDTNADDDEELEFLAIDDDVSGRVAGARDCDSLGVLP